MLLAQAPAFAADPPVADVPAAELLASGQVVTERGAVLTVEPGAAYLPPARLLATGKELAALRAENASMKESVSAVPSWLWFGGGAVAGGLVAAVVLHFLPAPAK
jgi:hypothetical protein